MERVFHVFWWREMQTFFTALLNHDKTHDVKGEVKMVELDFLVWDGMAAKNYSHFAV